MIGVTMFNRTCFIRRLYNILFFPDSPLPSTKISCVQILIVVVSHIQRIGYQPEKTTLHGSHSRSWSARQGKKERKKKKSGGASPPHTHAFRAEEIK